MTTPNGSRPRSGQHLTAVSPASAGDFGPVGRQSKMTGIKATFSDCGDWMLEHRSKIALGLATVAGAVAAVLTFGVSLIPSTLLFWGSFSAGATLGLTATEFSKKDGFFRKGKLGPVIRNCIIATLAIALVATLAVVTFGAAAGVAGAAAASIGLAKTGVALAVPIAASSVVMGAAIGTASRVKREDKLNGGLQFEQSEVSPDTSIRRVSNPVVRRRRRDANGHIVYGAVSRFDPGSKTIGSQNATRSTRAATLGAPPMAPYGVNPPPPNGVPTAPTLEQ